MILYGKTYNKTDAFQKKKFKRQRTTKVIKIQVSVSPNKYKVLRGNFSTFFASHSQVLRGGRVFLYHIAGGDGHEHFNPSNREMSNQPN